MSRGKSYLGIVIDYRETLKKYAYKKYGRRFGWRWLPRIDIQIAIMNAIIKKGGDNG